MREAGAETRIFFWRSIEATAHNVVTGEERGVRGIGDRRSRIRASEIKNVQPLAAQATLVEQVYEKILGEISAGRLRSNQRLIQDDLARTLGVSRQPVQQALLLLNSRGYLSEAPGRGLVVAPIDIDAIAELYEIRAVIEGLAARLSATRRDKPALKQMLALIKEGRLAVKQGALAKLIRADIEFHKLLYDMSGNGMIRETTQPNWPHFSRVMGEVLLQDETPRDIWDQHEAIASAIQQGDVQGAEKHAQDHILRAAEEFVDRLRRREAFS